MGKTNTSLSTVLYHFHSLGGESWSQGASSLPVPDSSGLNLHGPCLNSLVRNVVTSVISCPFILPSLLPDVDLVDDTVKAMVSPLGEAPQIFVRSQCRD